MFSLVGVFVQLAILGLELAVRALFGAGRLLSRTWKRPAGKVVLCGAAAAGAVALVVMAGAEAEGKRLEELSALEAGAIVASALAYVGQSVWAFFMGALTSDPVREATLRMWRGLFVEVAWSLEVNHLMSIALGAYAGRFIHVNLDGLLDAGAAPHESTLPRRDGSAGEKSPYEYPCK